jgi:hypothetical protein
MGRLDNLHASFSSFVPALAASNRSDLRWFDRGEAGVLLESQGHLTLRLRAGFAPGA